MSSGFARVTILRPGETAHYRSNRDGVNGQKAIWLGFVCPGFESMGKMDLLVERGIRDALAGHVRWLATSAAMRAKNT